MTKTKINLHLPTGEVITQPALIIINAEYEVPVALAISGVYLGWLCCRGFGWVPWREAKCEEERQAWRANEFWRNREAN